MGAVKSWLMDIEEKFWSDAEDIMKESGSFAEALKTIREKLTYPAIEADNDEVEDQLGEMWNVIGEKI
jgi:hypothetical protein